MPAQNLYRTNEEGTYSHVYNKGIENRIIFVDEDDYRVFLGYLEEYLSPLKAPESIKKDFTVNGRVFRGTPHQPKNYLGKVELLAYNLQPDHFHLLLHQKKEDSLQALMRSLCTRYSMYFNKKYQRTGALFEGPYKSVQIKDEDLPLLTSYMHKNGNYSSYSEYLKLKDSPWVNTKIVLSLRNDGEDYKDFIEKFVPNQGEKELLEKIVIEKNYGHLERRDLAENSGNNFVQNSVKSEDSGESPDIEYEDIYLAPNLKPLQRIPEIAVITIMFALLVTFGIRNITVPASERPELSVLGIKTVDSTTESTEPSPTPTLILTPTPVVKEEIKPKIILTIEIKDASASASAFVNIRQKPTANSEKIGKAKDGDTFEFVSIDSEWYEVKLATGSGFISAIYIKKGGTNN